jgi:competence protein ComEA
MLQSLILMLMLGVSQPISASNTNHDILNINTAKYSQLLGLPGIGRKRALSIVLYRQRRAFRRPVDLLRVEGIGRKLLKRLRPHIRVKELKVQHTKP